VNRPLRQLVGILRILSIRARDLGQPGLRVWTESGARLTARIGRDVSDLAHKNEVILRDWAARIRGILADGKVTPAEVAELERVPAALTDCAERSQDISEVVLP
jgi:hypothetical protein